MRLFQKFFSLHLFSFLPLFVPFRVDLAGERVLELKCRKVDEEDMNG